MGEDSQAVILSIAGTARDPSFVQPMSTFVVLTQCDSYSHKMAAEAYPQAQSEEPCVVVSAALVLWNIFF